MKAYYYKYFKETWLPQLKKQYKRAMKYKQYNTIKILKDNIFQNMNLSIKEKDRIWEKIAK